MRFAYADPPYLGCCGLYDHEHGSDGLCWDSPETHRQLVNALVDQYPDGWALSLSMPIRARPGNCQGRRRAQPWTIETVRLGLDEIVP